MNVLNWIIIFFVELLILCLVLYVVLILPFKYITARIYDCDPIDSGIIPKLCLLPFVWTIFNAVFSICICLSIVQNYIYNIDFNYKFYSGDYIFFVFSYLSIYLIVEYIRFIEYKVKYNISDEIVLRNKYRDSGSSFCSYNDPRIDYDEKKGYIVFSGKKVPINVCNGKKIIKLPVSPTRHGKDSLLGDDNTEYIIKSLKNTYTDKGVEDFYHLKLVAKNKVKYSIK